MASQNALQNDGGQPVPGLGQLQQLASTMKQLADSFTTAIDAFSTAQSQNSTQPLATRYPTIDTPTAPVLQRIQGLQNQAQHQLQSLHDISAGTSQESVSDMSLVPAVPKVTNVRSSSSSSSLSAPFVQLADDIEHTNSDSTEVIHIKEEPYQSHPYPTDFMAMVAASVNNSMPSMVVPAFEEFQRKRRKVSMIGHAKTHVKDIVVLPAVDTLEEGISIPRGESRAILASKGLIGKINIQNDWSAVDIEVEISNKFCKPFGLKKGQRLPYSYLSTMPGTKRLWRPMVAPGFQWNAPEVLTAAGQGSLYIMSHIPLQEFQSMYEPVEPGNGLDALLAQEENNTSHEESIPNRPPCLFRKIIFAVTEHVITALDQVKFHKTNGKSFVVCNYGAGSGEFTYSLMNNVCDYIRNTKRDSNFDIDLIVQEQPDNDFNALFSCMREVTNFVPGVNVMANATPSHQKCLPNGLVNFGFSAFSMHQLSQRPCKTSVELHSSLLTERNDCMAFKAQAQQDWETFILHRGRELAPGGQLVVLNFSTDRKEQTFGKTQRIRCSVFSVLSAQWKSLHDDKYITDAEFRNTVFCTYHRTEDEHGAPFLDRNSSVYQMGLRLLSMNTKYFYCPLRDRWLTGDRSEEESQEFASGYVSSVRTWAEATFRSALINDRSPEEKAQIINELFARVRADVLSCPINHGIDAVLVLMQIAKES